MLKYYNKIIFRKLCFERISIRKLKMQLKEKKEKEKWWHENKIYEKAFMNNLQTYIEFQKLSIYISFNKTSFLPFDFSLKKRITVFESYFLKCPCSYQLRGNLCTTHCLHSDICTPSFRFKTYLTHQKAIHVWQT